MKFLPSARKSTESTQILRSDELTPTELEANSAHWSTIPSLQQILDRKSLPPVCLYNLYIVMRDRLRNEEILDFYLDLKHHEVLWRKYIRSLSRGGMLDEADLKDGFNSISVAIKVQMFEKKMSVQSASLESSMKRDAASKTPDIIKQHEEQIINSHEVHEAAERIAHRYVVQSAHKEIVELPVSIRNDIIDFMQDERRFDPLIFANAKTWSFNAIQHSSYPKFMDIKSKGNITQWQQIFRLCLGLSALFVAFTLELTMMFLGWQVWGVRVWGLLPFWIATWSLISGLTALDPLLIILFNLSETTTFHYNKIQQPYIHRKLYRRAWVILIASTLLALFLLCLFCSIPGHRL